MNNQFVMLARNMLRIFRQTLVYWANSELLRDTQLVRRDDTWLDSACIFFLNITGEMCNLIAQIYFAMLKELIKYLFHFVPFDLHSCVYVLTNFERLKFKRAIVMSPLIRFLIHIQLPWPQYFILRNKLPGVFHFVLFHIQLFSNEDWATWIKFDFDNYLITNVGITAPGIQFTWCSLRDGEEWHFTLMFH
jgi:hypothetical protein